MSSFNAFVVRGRNDFEQEAEREGLSNCIPIRLPMHGDELRVGHVSLGH